MTSRMGAAYEAVSDRDTAIELVTERILPSQFDDLRRNRDAILPEGRLMLAVLEDAVRVYQHSSRLQDARNRRLFRETEEWFSSDDATSAFSFVTICQVFGLDPDYLRSGLRRWRSRHPTTHTPGRLTIAFRIRDSSGSRHQVTVARRSRPGARRRERVWTTAARLG